MIDLGFNPLLGPLSSVGGKRHESEIILVASLIDKAPNLGGKSMLMYSLIVSLTVFVSVPEYRDIVSDVKNY